MLNLSDVQVGLIYDRQAIPQGIGPPSIATINKELREKIFVNESRLPVHITPVFGLTGSETRQFRTGGLRAAEGKNRHQIIVGLIIHTSFATRSVCIKDRFTWAFKVFC